MISSLLLRSSQRAHWRSASVRLMSSVDVPEAPTSNHKHTPLPNATGKIIYTETDEAPALATFSLLPFINKVRLHFQYEMTTRSPRSPITHSCV